MSLWILIALALAAAAIAGLVTLGRARAKAAPSASQASGAEPLPEPPVISREESEPAPLREARERPCRFEPMAPPEEPWEPLNVPQSDLPSPSCEPSPAPPPDPDDDWRRGPRPLSVEVDEPGRSRSVRSLPAAFAARFYAFHPQEVAPGAWFRLHAYAARAGAEDEVQTDLERVTERPEELRQLRANASRPIAEGALITVTPRAEGVEFNPPRLELAFLRDVHRFDFDGRADAARAGGLAAGEILFSVAGVVIGAMPLAIYVALGDPAVEAPPLLFERVETTAYRKIFPSYSHRDVHVVRRVERAHRTLGDTVLRDALALRSGERWSPRLLELIEEADLFQLFWSPAAAESRYVADEWGHALGLVGRRQKPGTFVRPVYWREPLTPPPLPEALAALHFHFDPELDDRAAASPETP